MRDRWDRQCGDITAVACFGFCTRGSRVSLKRKRVIDRVCEVKRVRTSRSSRDGAREIDLVDVGARVVEPELERGRTVKRL